MTDPARGPTTEARWLTERFLYWCATWLERAAFSLTERRRGTRPA